MPLPSRPQHRIDLGTLPPLIPTQNASRSASQSPSPIDGLQHSANNNGTTSNSSNNGSRLGAFGLGSIGGVGPNRIGAGSPSHEHGGRLYSRRAREIQASEGGHSWGPPTASGLSTPLRETIPESPGDDTFPSFGSSSLDLLNIPSRRPSERRARAGTVPSRLPGGGSEASTAAGQLGVVSRSSRATPSASPHRPASSSNPDGASSSTASKQDTSSLLSRYRAGSMPQKSSYASSASSPFGPSIFSSNWNSTRGRSSTLNSHRSDDSPVTQAPGKDPLWETDMKTLSYLGLDDSGQQLQMNKLGYDGGYSSSNYPSSSTSRYAMLSELNRVPNNRFRSYSVNAGEKYAREEEDKMNQGMFGSGTLTPSAQANAMVQAAMQQQIHLHNLEVQAFANQVSSNRPRARTAGLLDAPPSRFWRSSAGTPSRLENTYGASGLLLDPGVDYEGLSDAVHALQLQNGLGRHDDTSHDEATRAIWLGGIPPSSTTSTLKVMFEKFGKIESARVLTHKGCGFINFENIDSAIHARAALNGTEIFPGAGPVRIGYAKTLSGSATPGAGGAQDPSGAPSGPLNVGQSTNDTNNAASDNEVVSDVAGTSANIVHPHLNQISGEIIQMVKEFGASPQEQARIAEIINRATRDNEYSQEIPPMLEPSQFRIHDAPRLREIRKRIDNQTCSSQELEDIAQQMLPEVAELSSDYLGNTVIQKLFEFCSEPTKEAMLAKIGPHLAEIGVHKNGTWAAQKIIDVAYTPAQKEMIISGLRPYSAASFLDQYGNYVMQCCLKFGAPANDFVFECMLSQLWKLSEGRFGARAMRACLESHHASKDQQKTLAAVVALHSVQLASNANGALLLTWYLDTCTFKNRRKTLAPRLIPHLVHLCTHKVAYMTVLKVINQREEAEARQMVLKALFFTPNDEVLEAVLKDPSCGATLIFKVLTTPFFDENLRADVIENTRKVLTKLKAQPSQGYKRLMDEVGMSARASSTNNNISGSGSNRDNAPATGSSPKKGGRPNNNQSSGSHAGSNAHFNAMNSLNNNGGTGGGMFHAAMPNQPNTYNTVGMGNGVMTPSSSFENFNPGRMNGPSYGANAMPPTMPPNGPLSYGQQQQQQPHGSHQQQQQQQGGPYHQSRPSGASGYHQHNSPPMMTSMNNYSSPIPNSYMSRSTPPMVPQNGYDPTMMGMTQGPWQQYPTPAYMVPSQPPMQAQGIMGAVGGNSGQRRGRVSPYA